MSNTQNKSLKVDIQAVGHISILDVDKKQIPRELEAWLNATTIIWVDTVDEEHIINPFRDYEVPSNTPQYIGEAVKEVLSQMQHLCECYNCQYVRLRTT